MLGGGRKYFMAPHADLHQNETKESSSEKNQNLLEKLTSKGTVVVNSMKE